MPIIQFKGNVPIQQLEIPELIIPKREKGKVLTAKQRREARAKLAASNEPAPEPKKRELSGNGSLHIRPGGTRVVTADELEYLRSDPVLKKAFNVLREKDPTEKEATAKTDPAPPNNDDDDSDDDDEDDGVPNLI